MANYPTTLPSTTPGTHGAVNDEIVAIATELGTDPSAAHATVKVRMDSLRGPVEPSDHGFLEWNQDPFMATTGTLLGVAGTLYFNRIRVRQQRTITNLHMFCSTAGATLTASQNIAALYTGAGALLSATGDQATAWASTGLKTMALTTAQSCAPGDYLVCLWWNGTTAPSFNRSNGTAISNVNLATTAARIGSADTALTTTAPATLAGMVATQLAWWVAVS